MKFSISVALALAGLVQVPAMPSDAALSTRHNDTYVCGTAGDAVASDCDKLFDLDFKMDYKRTCTYRFGAAGRRKAYNPVCLGTPGNCCIYTMTNDVTPDHVRRFGRELLQLCRSTEKNKVNGRIILPWGPAFCISDGRGCSDCLED